MAILPLMNNGTTTLVLALTLTACSNVVIFDDGTAGSQPGSDGTTGLGVSESEAGTAVADEASGTSSDGADETTTTGDGQESSGTSTGGSDCMVVVADEGPTCICSATVSEPEACGCTTTPDGSGCDCDGMIWPGACQRPCTPVVNGEACVCAETSEVLAPSECGCALVQGSPDEFACICGGGIAEPALCGCVLDDMQCLCPSIQCDPNCMAIGAACSCGSLIVPNAHCG